MNHLARTIQLSDRLRAMDGMEIAAVHGAYTRAAFRQDGENVLPVIICAHDEASDLPATLLSLANSDKRVWPIVVDDASHDETGAIAAHMGATVISAIGRGKTPAFQTGLRFLDQEHGYRGPLLATDADTIVGRRWSAALLRRLNEPPRDDGKLIVGPVIIRHGVDQATDRTRTLLLGGTQVLGALGLRRPTARGANMGFTFNETSSAAIMELIPTFPGSDVAIRDALGHAGLRLTATISPKAAVVTRGDRFASISSYVSHIRASQRTQAPGRRALAYN